MRFCIMTGSFQLLSTVWNRPIAMRCKPVYNETFPKQIFPLLINIRTIIWRHFWMNWIFQFHFFQLFRFQNQKSYLVFKKFSCALWKYRILKLKFCTRNLKHPRLNLVRPQQTKLFLIFPIILRQIFCWIITKCY